MLAKGYKADYVALKLRHGEVLYDHIANKYRELSRVSTNAPLAFDSTCSEAARNGSSRFHRTTEKTLRTCSQGQVHERCQFEV